MEIAEVIQELRENLAAYDITLYPPATPDDIRRFESRFGFQLPEEVKSLYQFSNGFESAEDMFRIIPLEENLEEGPPRPNSFCMAEYLIYSDMWDVNVNPSDPSDYSISNHGTRFRVLTDSISDFLTRFLAGGVFGKHGLYGWHEEIDQRSGKKD